jgi:hypothetical protein
MQELPEVYYLAVFRKYFPLAAKKHAMFTCEMKVQSINQVISHLFLIKFLISTHINIPKSSNIFMSILMRILDGIYEGAHA